MSDINNLPDNVTSQEIDNLTEDEEEFINSESAYERKCEREDYERDIRRDDKLTQPT